MTVTKENPFLAKISERRVLNRPGSQKCTVHVTLDISGSHMEYKVGDSIAVFPENAPLLVQKTLKALGFSGSEQVKDTKKGDTCSLQEYLSFRANITKVTKKWISLLVSACQDPEKKEALTHLLNHKEELKAYCESHQIWDCTQEFAPYDLSIDQVTNHLGALLPRFYSIASSHKHNPNVIDLVIAHFKYKTNDHLRFGVASHYLCEFAQLNTPSIALYLHPSKNFTLPQDPSVPIIMVGPGTGIAPFRGFMQERAQQKATSKNWLFFGDWNEKYDFYYEEEWKAYEQKGFLKLSTAFSRDQKEKIYVQDRLIEHKQEIWNWLERGAIFYVCGDAQYMAKDVDKALLDIVKDEGKMDEERAKEYLKNLRLSERYLRDVY